MYTMMLPSQSSRANTLEPEVRGVMALSTGWLHHGVHTGLLAPGLYDMVAKVLPYSTTRPITMEPEVPG